MAISLKTPVNRLGGGGVKCWEAIRLGARILATLHKQKSIEFCNTVENTPVVAFFSTFNLFWGVFG